MTRRAVALAREARLPVVATGGVRHATPRERPILDVLTAIRLRTPLEALGRRLPPNAEQRLRAPAEMARRFADLPEAVAATGEIAARAGFTLQDLGYRFPDYPVPDGRPQIAYLQELVEAGARERYRPVTARVRQQLDRELRLIEKLDARRLLPDRVGHRAGGAGARDPRPGPGLGGEQRGLLQPRDHRGRPDRDGPPLRALPLGRAGRVARHRPRPPVGGPPRGDHPVRLRALRRDERRDDRERHHLPAAARRARGGQGARPPAGLPRPPRQGRPRLGLPGSRTRGRRRGTSSGSAPTSRMRGSGASPRSGTPSSGSRAISASTRGAWCSARGGSTRWCRSSRRRCRAGSSSSGTRTTAPTSGSSRSTSSASG